MEDRSREKKPWSWATRVCVAVIAFAIGVGAYWASNFRRTPESTPPPPPPAVSYESAEPGSLRALILEAKARGDKKVELGVMACGTEMGGLRTALSRDTIVLAELVGKKTYEGQWGLYTWYRLRIKEILVDRPPVRPGSWLFQVAAPSDMLPVAEDEFLIQETNGRMEIDGVTVIQRSNGVRYVEGQTYLLFLLFDSSKQIAARSGTDPLGVFLVDNEGNLTSYIDEPYQLKTDLAKRYKNSVDNMRRALKK